MLDQNSHRCRQFVDLFVLEGHDDPQFFDQKQHLISPVLILMENGQITECMQITWFLFKHFGNSLFCFGKQTHIIVGECQIVTGSQVIRIIRRHAFEQFSSLCKFSFFQQFPCLIVLHYTFA
ncbi:hypothetical protein ACS72_03330 [Acinetobacter sp. VT 511]|nr:hypothetical protein ACS72_03330 [Acinetobacter sp. VT 511]